MCGIVGWVDATRDLTQEGKALEAMTETMKCRGPDASGLYLSREAAFGHRRLIVIDPEGGTQPMERRPFGAGMVITYNGEIYNMPDLRREILAAGLRPVSRCDTELVLLAYALWGEDCVLHMDGIFAFGIWDQKKRRLFMARDRLGVKPIFYWQKGRTLLFASELKGILAHPEVEARVGSDGLAEILTMGPARTPGHGIFQDTYELRPGHTLIFDADGLRVRRFWALESRDHADDEEATAREVRRLLRSAVERQLVSDVPVSTFLSGGLDSSVVSAIASRYLEQEGRGRLRTFSVDFVDQSRHFRPTDFQTNLDAPWVSRVCDVLNTDHTDVVLDTSDLVEGLLPSLRARDYPGMADVDTSLLLFCQQIKEGATVALSGEAADEIFGGYPWCHKEDALAADTFPWARRIQDRLSILSPEALHLTGGAAYVDRRYREALDEVPRLEGETGREARIREILYLNITRFLANLLERKDRMSMATGLEVRVPFCDHRLVEYVWNIPWSIKNAGGMAKGILRKAMEGFLPWEILARRKSPYPSTANPSYGAACREWMVSILEDGSSPVLPLLDQDAVRNLTRMEGEMAELPWFGQLMGVPQLFAYLIQMDAWMREYHVRIS